MLMMLVSLKRVNDLKLHLKKNASDRQSKFYLFPSPSVPPDVSAVCTAQSIIFRINHPKQAGLWEVCVGHQALTSDLSRQEGYILKNDSQSISLEVPLYTSGYIYEVKKNLPFK